MWKGKKFVYSGDTVPNKWPLAEARDADLLIHKCYFTVQQLIDLKHYNPERARIVSTVIHTPPSSCGKIFSQLQLPMVIGTDEAWPADSPHPDGPPDRSERTEQSGWLKAGRIDLLH